MSKIGWICEKCFSPFDTEGAAVKCELSHTSQVLEVIQYYDPFDSIPVQLRVRFAVDGSEEYAIFVRHSKMLGLNHRLIRPG